MKIISTNYDYNLTAITQNLLSQGSCYLDIETTGFKASYQTIYLIGLMRMEGDQIVIRQLFAENETEEKDILLAFNDYVKDITTIITFNGKRFDLPFIEERLKKNDLTAIPSSVQSLDIYQEIKPCKDLLGLSALNQKAIELFLGIHREDQYSGGDLITVYKQYEIEKNPKDEELLLLHNLNDMQGMLPVSEILSFKDAIQSFQMDDVKLDGKECIILSRTTDPITFPIAVRKNSTYFYLIMKDNQIRVSIPLFHGKFKYFLPNYGQYVKLIDENMLIPKELSSGIDKASYRKVTASECYIEVSGTFLRIPAGLITNQKLLSENEKLYQTEYKSKEHFIQIDLNNLNRNWLEQYAKLLFALI